MNFLDYLALVRRRWAPCLVITAVVTLSAIVLVQWKNNKPFETTVFLSIGSSQQPLENAQSGIYESVQAADQFSETVMGWFKNPQFIDRINASAASITDISARKQEKTNVVVTYSTSTKSEADKIGAVIKDQLNNEISSYDLMTNDHFQTAVLEASTKEKPLSLLLFGIIGVLAGLVLASFALYGYEYLFRKISSPQQASEILKKNAIETLKNLRPKDRSLSFLVAYLHKIPGKSVQLITAGPGLTHLTGKLEKMMKSKTFHLVDFPKDSLKINDKDHHVVICRLGKTAVDDLEKIQTLLSASFDLVIVET